MNSAPLNAGVGIHHTLPRRHCTAPGPVLWALWNTWPHSTPTFLCVAGGRRVANKMRLLFENVFFCKEKVGRYDAIALPLPRRHHHDVPQPGAVQW